MKIQTKDPFTALRSVNGSFIKVHMLNAIVFNCLVDCTQCFCLWGETALMKLDEDNTKTARFSLERQMREIYLNC